MQSKFEIPHCKFEKFKFLSLETITFCGGRYRMQNNGQVRAEFKIEMLNTTCEQNGKSVS